MLNKSILTLSVLLSSVNVFAEDMPADVADMITTMTQELNSGKARESLRVRNPYNYNSTEKYHKANSYEIKTNKVIKVKDKLSKAKFILDVKVISCLKDKVPDFLTGKVEKHDACGDLDSQVIYDDTVDVFLTKESRFDNLKPAKIIRTIPEISKQDDNYVIKDKQIINTAKLGVELFVTPTTIIKKQVQLDMAVRTTELADIDEVYMDSNDKNFVNNEVALKHRFLVTSFPVDINNAETLGGNSAILVPLTSDFKSVSAYPETARLWLEVKLSLPV